MLEQVKEGVDQRISPILSEIVDDLGMLLRQEVALAKSEIRVQAEHAVNAGIAFAGATILGIVGGCLFCIAAALWLVQHFHVSPWLCFFSIGLAVLVVAALLVLYAKARFRKLSLVPEKTIQSLTEAIDGERG